MPNFNNIFSQDVLNYINSLNEVIQAKDNLTLSNSKVSFDITLTDAIRESLSTIGLDLTNKTTIPMRWITGDTAEHIDIGTSAFTKTYLVFMTNSQGSFDISDVSYPITENTAYVFDEGLPHKTQNTQGARLLLGPMNEYAQPVGRANVEYYLTEADALDANYGPNPGIIAYGSSFTVGIIDYVYPTYDPFSNYPGAGNAWYILPEGNNGSSAGIVNNGDTLNNDVNNNNAFYRLYITPNVPCFVEGTRVLTQNGYKAVETLNDNDRIQTSDKRFVNFKLIKTNVEKTDYLTAPYKIEPGAFGKKLPNDIVRLSPTHKILIRKGVWTSPEWAAQTNIHVKQYGIGEPITYYHIECENYLKDNLVTEGLIVESFGTLKSAKGLRDIYKWNNKLNGFTRIAYNPKKVSF